MLKELEPGAPYTGGEAQRRVKELLLLIRELEQRVLALEGGQRPRSQINELED